MSKRASSQNATNQTPKQKKFIFYVSTLKCNMSIFLRCACEVYAHIHTEPLHVSFSVTQVTKLY